MQSWTGFEFSVDWIELGLILLCSSWAGLCCVSIRLDFDVLKNTCISQILIAEIILGLHIYNCIGDDCPADRLSCATFLNPSLHLISYLFTC